MRGIRAFLVDNLLRVENKCKYDIEIGIYTKYNLNYKIDVIHIIRPHEFLIFEKEFDLESYVYRNTSNKKWNCLSFMENK